MSEKRTALVLGGSGLVGGEILRTLLAEHRYGKVIALVRSDLRISHEKLEQRRFDFNAIGNIPAVDDLYCALGTTIATAGSKEMFRKVDFTYVHEVARAARRSGIRQFLLVSSTGASSGSSIFYSRVKGEIEEAVGKLGFEGTQIFRPSILVGEREEKRTAEKTGTILMNALSFAMLGPLRKYRPITARNVARAMVRIALAAPPGVNIFESDMIEAQSRMDN